MTPDAELLNRYASQHDEAAFAELVHRHLDHVYSTALRLVGGDIHLAEDVAQAAFTDLARKAVSLRECHALSGWLHTSARFAAAKIVRTEQRRRQREQIAITMPATSSAPASDWEQVRLFLDETIGELGHTDRDALLLRFFEKKPFAEVGTALGLSENAARMRVDRALDKLRSRLAAKGITSTTVALGATLTQHVVSIAPSALGSQIVSHALACNSAASATSVATAGKLALAGAVTLVLVTVGVLLKPNSSPTQSDSALPVTREDTHVATQAVLSSVANLPRNTIAAKTDVQPRRGLELLFVDDQTGLPITNHIIALRGWERGAQLLVEKKVKLEEGRCIAPFDARPKAAYWILTTADGYADVRLRWHPSLGEEIPEFYTVRLIQPALIRGRVVDANGNPVAGATVGFNTENVSAEGETVEDHCVSYLTVTTDSDGRWQIHRLAPEMLRCLFGSASHPDYSRSEMRYASRQPELIQQLLDGTAVFHLGAGITVYGFVQDENGQPITNAVVHVGCLDDSRNRDVRTEFDGSFKIGGCKPCAGIISAEAEGYAPAALSVKLDANLQPVRLGLGQGRTLRVRVVTPSGIPVAGAILLLDSFPRSHRSLPIPQIELQRKTDAEGRAIWNNAPDQQLEFAVTAAGHVRVSMELRPSDEEQVIILQPSLVINGVVRDAVTGELIPRFRIGIGWPEKEADGSMHPSWSTIDRFRLNITGGRFRHVLDEPVVGGGVANPGYVFRFEADGHAPFVTRVYEPNEGEVRLDVQLRPVEDIWVSVYLPDGRIARDAQAGFVAPGSNARLVPGGFAGALGYSMAGVRRVDALGRFVVPDDESIERVVIAHTEGYAESSPGELRRVSAVRLRPWARVEGVWRENGQSVANGEVSLLWRTNRPVDMDAGAFQVNTDTDGRFTFPKVPPGSLQLITWRTTSDPRMGKSPQVVAIFTAGAGETNQFVIGDEPVPPAQSSGGIEPGPR